MNQKTFKRLTSIVIYIIFWIICFRILYGIGINPLFAAICIVMIKSIFRFIFRLSVILVTVTMVLLFISVLICL